MNASYIIIGILVILGFLYLIIIIDAFRSCKGDKCIESPDIKTQYLFPDGSVISSYSDAHNDKFYVSIPVTSNFNWEGHRYMTSFKDDPPRYLRVFGVYTDESNQKPIVIPITIDRACYPTIVFTDDLARYISELYGRDRCLIITPNNKVSNSKLGDIYEDS